VIRNLQNVAPPVPFDLTGVVVGLMGHMMTSIIFGLIFTFLIAPRLRTLGSQVIVGMIYGAAIFVVTWLIVVPAVDPVMRRLNGLAFLIGHLMFGVALGAVNYWVTR